jgi:hypothetical protein
MMLARYSVACEFFSADVPVQEKSSVFPEIPEKTVLAH